MDIFIFVLVIVVLILVHEFGHFVAAKLSGMRVDEFGIGFPPRALTIAKIGDTEYTLNWIPFGGFVKIYGENSEADLQGTNDLKLPHTDKRAFTDKNRFLQSVVLVAGVAMNFALAYVLITGALVVGTPRALTTDELPLATKQSLAVASVLPGSPASDAGLRTADSIVRAETTTKTWEKVDPESFTAFIASTKGESVTLSVQRGGEAVSVVATPKQHVVTSDASRYALGVSVMTIGVVPVSFGKALVEGASLTWGVTVATAQGLVHFLAGLLTLSADLSQVAGPIGIAGAVGDATSAGFGDLLSIMAIISINLALINLIPIPALDGGRLLFVLIESVIRRPIKPSITVAVNSVGFVLLVLLMAVVTIHDIYKIVG